ncbi:hypothetical protein GCM10023350_02350 [Nocardioides endophyticus]|uniref:HTH arsR-type domain-containing protein n=1 Tax=Nocardioides endophyticus TaxID=1353775 RepID=A0ABP8Y920_9ACTN
MDPYAALADPVRRSLLRALAGRPQRVVDLADGLPISRPAVSKHLRLLAEAGLVTVEARGRERHYALVREGLAPVTAYVDSLVVRTQPLTEHALDALDTEVRRTGRERRQTTPTEETA